MGTFCSGISRKTKCMYKEECIWAGREGCRRETLATSFRLWMSTEWLCLSKIWPFQLSNRCVGGKTRNNRWFVVGENCHATYIKSSASVWPYFLLDLPIG